MFLHVIAPYTFEIYNSQLHLIFDLVIRILSYIIPVWLIFILITKIKQRTLTFIECFFIVNFFGILFWPLNDGARYYLPIFIFAVYFTLEFLEKLFEQKFKSNHLIVVIASILIFLNIIGVYQSRYFDDNEIYTPTTKAMFEWVKENKEEQVFMFRRPRVLALFSEAEAVMPRYVSHNPQNLIEHINRYEVTHLIQSNNHPIGPIEELYKTNFTFELQWENEDYKIYMINPI